MGIHLRELEAQIQTLHHGLLNMRASEAELRDLNGEKVHVRGVGEKWPGSWGEFVITICRPDDRRLSLAPLLAEATNSRVAWLSITSLLVCVALAVWQVVYLKGFFERKKLL